MTTLRNWSTAVIREMLNAVPAVWEVAVPEMPLAASVVPSVKVCPGKVSNRASATPATRPRVPKTVPLTAPLIAAVPPMRVIEPVPGIFAPSFARTCNPLMVRVSDLVVFPTVRVIVAVVLVIEMEAADISRAP